MSRHAAAVRTLITAEHASREVPARWRACFDGEPGVLDTHRSWDEGSLRLATALAEALTCPLMQGEVTRLLVDLNRPETHRDCFSEFSRSLDGLQRCELLDRFHRPYWQAFRERVGEPGRCLHLASHSFTPVWAGRVRRSDIGLLFDPARPHEAEWCRGVIGTLRQKLPGLRIHANQPYRGTSSGLGQFHRTCFPADKLLTAELEINVALLDRDDWAGLLAVLTEALLEHLR